MTRRKLIISSLRLRLIPVSSSVASAPGKTAHACRKRISWNSRGSTGESHWPIRADCTREIQFRPHDSAADLPKPATSACVMHVRVNVATLANRIASYGRSIISFEPVRALVRKRDRNIVSSFVSYSCSSVFPFFFFFCFFFLYSIEIYFQFVQARMWEICRKSFLDVSIEF